MHGDTQASPSQNHAFVVVGSTGEYSDFTTWIARVFDEESDAEAFCAALNDWLKENELHKSDADVDYDDCADAECELDPSLRVQYTGASYDYRKVPRGLL